MQVHIILDNRRVERAEQCLQEVERQQIPVTRYWQPVPDTKSVVRSINLSHKAIIQYAKDNRLPEVCVLEDDVFFPAADGWQYFLRNKPSDFDIYLGGTYALEYPVTNPISRIDGFHCYIMAERFYDTFLSVPDDVHIDTVLDGKGLFHLCYPMAAIQRPAWSYNLNQFTDRNRVLREGDVYVER